MFSRLILFFVFTCVICFFSYSQETDTLLFKAREDSLCSFFRIAFQRDSVRFVATDTEKRLANKEIVRIFNEILSDRNSFDWPFDSLRNVGIIHSEDGFLRILTWNLKFADGTYEYFGYMQYLQDEKKKYFLIPLVDKSDEILNPEDATLYNYLWYGVLYYKVLTRKTGGKTYYTLLGWDGNNYMSNKKIIDVVSFNSSGKATFGKPIFKVGRKTRRRMLFEYSYRNVMMLIWDERYNAIVFDHLAPPSNMYKNNFQFYGPDGTYDALKFERGKWILYEDVLVGNPKKTN